MANGRLVIILVAAADPAYPVASIPSWELTLFASFSDEVIWVADFNFISKHPHISNHVSTTDW